MVRPDDVTAGGRRDDAEPRRLSCPDMGAKPLPQIIDTGWAEALEPVADRITEMGEFLRAENAADADTSPRGRTSYAPSPAPSTRCAC